MSDSNAKVSGYVVFFSRSRLQNRPPVMVLKSETWISLNIDQFGRAEAIVEDVPINPACDCRVMTLDWFRRVIIRARKAAQGPC